MQDKETNSGIFTLHKMFFVLTNPNIFVSNKVFLLGGNEKKPSDNFATDGLEKLASIGQILIIYVLNLYIDDMWEKIV